MLQQAEDATTVVEHRVRAGDPDVDPDDYDEDEDDEDGEDEDEEDEDGREEGQKWYVWAPAGVARRMRHGA